MKVVQVNYAYAAHLEDPASLLDAYETLTAWSEAVQSAGARVSVVQAFHRDATLVRNEIVYEFRASGDRIRDTNRRRWRWRWPRPLITAVLDQQPDLVHVNSLEFAAETWLLRRALPPSTSLVVQDHASGLPSPGIASAIRRRFMQPVEAFLFTSVEQAAGWRSRGFIRDSQPVHQVLESSTSLRPIDREEARSRSHVDGQPAVLWVGRLNETKDPLTVLEGFARVLEALPDAVLTMIYASGTLLPAVRDAVNQSRALREHVRLVGPVPREALPAFYSAADLFVLGSHHEGSGYALLEACACGVIPVVTRIPSFRAMTADGQIGMLWTPGDARMFARSVIDVAGRNLEIERQRTRTHFEQELSWPVVGRRACAIYEDVRTARARPSATVRA